MCVSCIDPARHWSPKPVLQRERLILRPLWALKHAQTFSFINFLCITDFGGGARVAPAERAPNLPPRREQTFHPRPRKSLSLTLVYHRPPPPL